MTRLLLHLGLLLALLVAGAAQAPFAGAAGAAPLDPLGLDRAGSPARQADDDGDDDDGDDDDDLDDACEEEDDDDGDDDDGVEERFCRGQAIVGLKPGTKPAVINQKFGTATIAAIPGRNIYLLRVQPGQEAQTIARLRTDSRVRWAELNAVESNPESRPSRFFLRNGENAPSSPTASSSGTSYGRTRIGAQLVRCVNGRGVTVAVIDTGVDLGHPRLKGRLGRGWNAFTGRPGGANDAVAGTSAGHGTHVAGIVLQAAPGATILPIKALNGAGDGQAFVLTRAIFHAVGQDAEVINLSLGASRNSRAVQEAIKAAQKERAVVVAAAGNAGQPAPPEYPAALAGVLAVTATDRGDDLPEFASTNGSVDLAAPGVDIASTYPRGIFASPYATWSGTSMATPWVSGTVALMLDKQPQLPPNKVAKRLRATAKPLGEPGTGAGRVNANAAVACGRR